MDKFKKGDLITNSSGSFAKVLRVGVTVLATKWFESPKDAMGATDGSVCFNDRAVKVLGIRAVSKKSNDNTATTTATVKEVKDTKEAKPVKEVKDTKKEVAPTDEIDLDKLDMIEHIVTEQDLEINPDWAENGVEVGDSIFYKENPTDEDIAEAIKVLNETKGKTL